MKNRTLCVISRSLPLILAILISASALIIPASAADTVKSMVNVADSNKNMHGPGYEWDNVEKVLTLKNVNIDTEDDYGIRIPRNCTVILKGDNYIKASKHAVALLGTVVFKGSGSLTLEAGEYGFYLTTLDNTQKVRLLEGDYKITAGKHGVYSENADFSFIGGTMKIKVTSDDGNAICGRNVNILGGKFESNAPVFATHTLTLESANIDIDAKDAAISAKILYMENLSIDEYNGETKINITSTAPRFRDSIIFGEGVPSLVDYILMAILLCGIIAAIAIPAIRKKKKAEALYKKLEAEGYITK